MTEHLTQTQRDDYIDASKRHALEVLDIPEVQRRLGGYVNTLFALTNSVVPAAVENRMIVASEAPSKALPVTVLRAGEEAMRLVAGSPFDAYQREAMRQKYGEAGAQWIISDYKRMQRGRSSVSLQPFESQVAYTHTQGVHNARGERIMGRPMVAFNYDRSALPYADAPVWFHDFMHAQQAREMPVWDANINVAAMALSQELEGYRVGAMTILGIQEAGRQGEFLASIPRDSLDRTLEIEEIRVMANRYETDPYAATRKVAQELVNNGHPITSFLKDKIASK